MKVKILITLLVSFFSFINMAAADVSSLSVENAWVAEAPPVSKVMVGYMTIINSGKEDLEITAAESELYSSIEFHETVYQDGMAGMVRHKSLRIPAGERLELKRGGPHLMLFNPVKHLIAGDTVKIKFSTKNQATKTISVAVTKARY